jgi:hypothetical protein
MLFFPRNDLTKLQEEQVTYIRKIENEKQRKEFLDDQFENAKLQLRLIQEKTRNGNIVKDHEMMNQKLLGRLEYQLQTSNSKLSIAKNENLSLKVSMQKFRREKMLHLQILNDLVRIFVLFSFWMLVLFLPFSFSSSQYKEIKLSERKTKYKQDEILSIHDKKQKIKNLMTNIKQKMIHEMQEFSQELHKAKSSITSTQKLITSTIRDSLEQVSSVNNSFFMPEESVGTMRSGKIKTPLTSSGGAGRQNKSRTTKSRTGGTGGGGGYSETWNNSFSNSMNMDGFAPLYSPGGNGNGNGNYNNNGNGQFGGGFTGSFASVGTNSNEPSGHNPAEAESLLRETEFNSLEELLMNLDKSEEDVFNLYNDIQMKHQEVEKMEVDNKTLESKVHEQVSKIVLYTYFWCFLIKRYRFSLFHS